MPRISLKRLVALCFACLLCCASALAEPRYPGKTGDATDAALLLSAQTLSDWARLAENVKDETGVRLYLATVDFLDGATLAEYGAGLRDKWDLGKKDLLLLMAAGEDTFGFFGGESVNEKFSVSAQEKLLSTAFQAKFLAQDYDGALASLGPALARELGKCYGGDHLHRRAVRPGAGSGTAHRPAVAGAAGRPGHRRAPAGIPAGPRHPGG